MCEKGSLLRWPYLVCLQRHKVKMLLSLLRVSLGALLELLLAEDLSDILDD